MSNELEARKVVEAYFEDQSANIKAGDGCDEEDLVKFIQAALQEKTAQVERLGDLLRRGAAFIKTLDSDCMGTDNIEGYSYRDEYLYKIGQALADIKQDGEV